MSGSQTNRSSRRGRLEAWTRPAHAVTRVETTRDCAWRSMGAAASATATSLRKSMQGRQTTSCCRGCERWSLGWSGCSGLPSVCAQVGPPPATGEARIRRAESLAAHPLAGRGSTSSPLGPVRAELVELPLAHEGTSGCSAAWMPLGANAVRNAYGLQPSRRRRGRRGSVWPRLQARPRGKVPTVAIARHYRFRMAALVEWALRRRRAKALRQLLNFAVGVYSRVSPNGLPSESRQIAHCSPGARRFPRAPRPSPAPQRHRPPRRRLPTSSVSSGKLPSTWATSLLLRTISPIWGHWRTTFSAKGTPRM